MTLQDLTRGFISQAECALSEIIFETPNVACATVNDLRHIGRKACCIVESIARLFDLPQHVPPEEAGTVGEERRRQHDHRVGEYLLWMFEPAIQIQSSYPPADVLKRRSTGTYGSAIQGLEKVISEGGGGSSRVCAICLEENSDG